jgi:hypothetical protein
MKYCPVCESEFLPPAKVCPVHNIELESHKKAMRVEKYIDIYKASDEVEAERVASILNEMGIEAHLTATGISQMPLLSDNAILIAVLREEKDRAVAIINQARQDQIISYAGSFM